MVLPDMHLSAIDGRTPIKDLRHPDCAAIPLITLIAPAPAGERAKALEAGCDDDRPTPGDSLRLGSPIDLPFEHWPAA